MEHEGVSFDESGDRLRISWDNRKVKKPCFTFWFLSLFLVLWIPLTLIATKNIFTSGEPLFFSVWCVFGWLGSIIGPWTLLQRRCKEWIEIVPEKITWGASGPFARKTKNVEFSRIRQIGLGYHAYDTRGRNGRECIITLNLHEHPGSTVFLKRHTLGYWLNKDHKRMIFDHIIAFAAKRNIPLDTTDYKFDKPA